MYPSLAIDNGAIYQKKNNTHCTLDTHVHFHIDDNKKTAVIVQPHAQLASYQLDVCEMTTNVIQQTLLLEYLLYKANPSILYWVHLMTKSKNKTQIQTTVNALIHMNQ